MAILHLLHQPFSVQQFTRELERYVNPGDKVLLLNDAVFSLPELQAVILKPIDRQESPTATLNWTDFELLAIDEQLTARGLQNYLGDQVYAIDYQAFVQLSVDCEKTISW